MNLLLVRHGETLWNLEERYQGQQDIPLSDKGLKQALQTSAFLKNEDISAIYTSDLSRAYLTADMIAKEHGLAPIADIRLREMAFGCWEGLTRAEILKKYAELYHARFKDSLNTRIPGGELPGEVVQRLATCVTELCAKHANQTVVVVSHGGSMRLLIASLLHIPLEKSYCLRMGNTGISKLCYRRHASQCIWEACYINCTNHLKA